MIRPLCLAFLLTAAAAAQTAVLTSTAPATSQVTSGGQASTTTLAAGPLASFGTTGETLGGSTTAVSWDSIIQPTGIVFTLISTAFCQPGATATFAGSDFVYELSSPTPVLTQLDLRRIGTMSNATVMVDVGDDGTVEFSETSVASTVSLTITLGPTPLSIRIRNDYSLLSAGGEQATLAITATPLAGIFTTQVVIGCDTGHSMIVQPTFDNAISLGVIGPLPATKPSVMILGASLQPILLPTTASFPCLLLPSLDVTLFPGNQFVTVQAPAAVRPFTFWAQAVVLHPTELRTTNAMQVVAF